MTSRRNDELPKGWLLCDEGVCLYADDRRIDRLKSDVPRCIKHGAILSPAWMFAGKSRGEARKSLAVRRRVDAEQARNR